MKKIEFIKQYGEEAYEKRLVQKRAYYKAHKEEENARVKKYNEEHPEEVIAANHEQSRKGGKRYEKMLAYCQTGIPGGKKKIRRKHQKEYKPYKDIIAPDSQLHHQWCPQSASYTGLALVETDQHMRGFIDVIEILEGEIRLLTEEEVRNGGEYENIIKR